MLISIKDDIRPIEGPTTFNTFKQKTLTGEEENDGLCQLKEQDLGLQQTKGKEKLEA